jgi:hypothetical protein
MLRTNIVVETQPGRAQGVAEVIGHLSGMEAILVDGDHRVMATWTVPDGQHPEPEGFSEVLRAMSPEILEVALLDAPA